MILVTGPTGSGKTTTLYSVLSMLNSEEDKIITIEDPVEYQIEGLNQIQIKPDIGLTFASALRSILRHDPDIIMVGEIRDKENRRDIDSIRPNGGTWCFPPFTPTMHQAVFLGFWKWV